MANIMDQSGGERAQAMRLRDFLHDCTGSAPCEETDRVRDAVALLDGIGTDGAGPTLDHGRVEAMLECGAALSAVLEIIGKDTAFMLSRGGNGSLATVVPADATEESTGEGSTLALAMLSGYVAAVLARVERESHLPPQPAAPASMLVH